MLQKFAIIFGFAFIVVGILGFIPAVTPNNHLLGIFHVNTVHNLVDLLSGIIALWCGFTSSIHSLNFFRIFGVVYGIVAALGFVYGDQDILGLVANNTADSWLHVVIAAGSLYLGFFHRSID